MTTFLNIDDLVGSLVCAYSGSKLGFGVEVKELVSNEDFGFLEYLQARGEAVVCGVVQGQV